MNTMRSTAYLLRILVVTLIIMVVCSVGMLAAFAVDESADSESEAVYYSLSAWEELPVMDGAQQKGWYKYEGTWYYADPDTGNDHTGWLFLDPDWYFFNADGSMRTGWLSLRGRWYYFGADGRMITGWRYLDGDWYYFDRDTGKAHTGWLEAADGWYYFDSDGTMRTEWLQRNGKWYYFDSNGRMVTGWIEINSKWYCFDTASGASAQNAWKQRDNGEWFYYDNTGEPCTGWQQIGNHWYYFWSDGSMAVGWMYLDNSWYFFERDTGHLHHGWAMLNGYWFYMRPEDGTPQTYWREIGGEWYYFGRDGRMHTGWNRIYGYDYYFYQEGDGKDGITGAMAHDVWVDDIWLQEDGIAWTYRDPYTLMLENAQTRTSQTEYLIMIDTANCVMGVFQGEKGNWDLLYYWYCTPGTSSTPTVTGEFQIEDKGDYFYSGSAKCWYWCAFYQGLYCIHSTLYYSDGSVMNSTVGDHLSHGCVRLQIDNAYWVWTTCPIGTAVITY